MSSTPTFCAIWPLTFGKLEVHYFPQTVLPAWIIHLEFFNSIFVHLSWKIYLNSWNIFHETKAGLCYDEDLCKLYFWNDKTTNQFESLNKRQKKQLLACGFSLPLWLQPPIDFYLGKSQSVKTTQSRAKNTEEIRQFALINENIPWFVGTQRRP